MPETSAPQVEESSEETNDTPNGTPVTEAVTDPELAPIRLLSPSNEEEALKFVELWANTPGLMDDRLRKDEQTVLNFFVNTYQPPSLVYLIGDWAAFAAFVNVNPGWRATSVAARFKRDGGVYDREWKVAAQAAMIHHRLHVLDSFVPVENRVSRIATRRLGFRYRGLINDALCYNRRVQAVRWSTMERADLGLLPL